MSKEFNLVPGEVLLGRNNPMTQEVTQPIPLPEAESREGDMVLHEVLNS